MFPGRRGVVEVEDTGHRNCLYVVPERDSPIKGRHMQLPITSSDCTHELICPLEHGLLSLSRDGEHFILETVIVIVILRLLFHVRTCYS